MHGDGKYVFSSGAEYEGEWIEGKMNGKGKLIYSSGSIYEGIFI